jgi:hypothetical protein
MITIFSIMTYPALMAQKFDQPMSATDMAQPESLASTQDFSDYFFWNRFLPIQALHPDCRAV